MSREEIIEAIRSGPGIMPSYEERLTDGELGELADWLLVLGEPESSGQNPPP